ncbi:MAG: hypothetical protein PHI32_07105 [Dysgonamonadaceae bacterium]|nr:hypothetical protein [Dysgonamonadaceae bacterium]
MINHIFRSLRAIINSESAKSVRNDVYIPTHSDTPCVEDHDEHLEHEDNIDPPIDYSCISSDFTEDMLAMEMMRLGSDPANMSRKQMIEVLYKKMDSNKPPTTEDTTIETC